MEVPVPFRGPRLVSLPFSDYCRPQVENEDHAEEFENKLLQFTEEREINFEIRSPLSFEHAGSFCNFIHQGIPLSNDPEVTKSRMKRTTLQNVETAIHKGVTVLNGSSLSYVKRFYQLQVETRKRHGMLVQPYKFFSLVHKRILEANLGSIFLAFVEEEVVTGIVVFFARGL